MVKEKNFTIVNAHVILTFDYFNVIAHHAQGQKLQPGTSQMERKRT